MSPIPKVSGLPWREQAEFEPEFIGNAPLPPREIVVRHLSDERLQHSRNRGPSRGRCAAPALLEPLAPPPPERLRLYHRERLLPVEPLRAPDQRKARGVSGAPRLGMACLIQRSLFPQEEVSASRRRMQSLPVRCHS